MVSISYVLSQEVAQHALLQPDVEAAEDPRRDVVQRDFGHPRKARVGLLDLRVQQVVQLRCELDARRPTPCAASSAAAHRISIAKAAHAPTMQKCSSLRRSSSVIVGWFACSKPARDALAAIHTVCSDERR